MAKIGIDFGTTNSYITAFDKERFAFKPLMKNDKPLSSTVWYHDDIVDVGNEARKNINTYHDVEGHHFEKSIKLKLGTKIHSSIFGQSVSPHEIAGTIIKQIHEDADERSIDDVSQAVFTMPIKFSGKSREDLRKAANYAGMEITTFIHEPFAAFIGYLFSSKKIQSDADINKILDSLNNNNVIVFDWGGGTLDITVINIKDHKMTEIGTAELTNIAGDKFDEEIAKYVWQEFCSEFSDQYSEEELDRIRTRKWDKILSAAETCKINLSRPNILVDDVIVEDITPEDDLKYEVTRSTLENLLQDYFDKAFSKIDEAMKKAGVKDIDIKYILLSGGTCKIPAVINQLADRYGHRVITSNDADRFIGQGAAVIAEYGWMPYLTKNIMVELCDDTYCTMIEKDTPIAVGNGEKEEVFTCVDQRSKNAKVIICEGVEEPKNVSILGILNVPTLGQGKFGDDVVVKMELDKNIMLDVKAYSLMVNDSYDRENKAIMKQTKISQLCFGLDCSQRG